MNRKIQMPEYMRTMPDGSIIFPRDNEIATRSADILFLARVLTVFSKGRAMLNVYRNINNDFFCLIEDREGDLYNSITGVMRKDPGYNVMSPERTWELLCGREYKLALCPHRLRYFGSRLSKMN